MITARYKLIHYIKQLLSSLEVNSVGNKLNETISKSKFYGSGQNERVMTGSPITSVRLT